MTEAVPGQQDILDTLRFAGDKTARKAEASVEMRPAPPELVAELREHHTDFWHHVVPCPGCGQVNRRRALYAGHGVQFDKDGTGHLPPAAGLGGESGVCGLMADVAIAANVAIELAANNPVWVEWKTRCYRHEFAKRRCPDKCWADHAEHTAAVATRVWGSVAWRSQKWGAMTS